MPLSHGVLKNIKSSPSYIMKTILKVSQIGTGSQLKSDSHLLEKSGNHV